MASHQGPERRPAERLARCRACEKPIQPGEEMISWYSSANRGMNIHLDLACAEKIGKLAAPKLCKHDNVYPCEFCLKEDAPKKECCHKTVLVGHRCEGCPYG